MAWGSAVSYLYRAGSTAHSEALYGLQMARLTAEARDQHIPCTGLQDCYFASDDGMRAMAAKACRHCPVRHECANVAPFESWGVWGGIDRQRAGAA